MALLRVHDYQVDRATNIAKIVKVSPLRRWISDQHPPIIYQNGQFMWDNGAAVPAAEVPAYIRKALQQSPIGAGKIEESETTLRICPLCPGDVVVASDEYEAHLVQHARQGALPTPEVEPAEVTVEPEPVPTLTPRRPRGRPRKLAPSGALAG